MKREYSDPVQIIPLGVKFVGDFAFLEWRDDTAAAAGIRCARERDVPSTVSLRLRILRIMKYKILRREQNTSDMAHRKCFCSV